MVAWNVRELPRESHLRGLLLLFVWYSYWEIPTQWTHTQHSIPWVLTGWVSKQGRDTPCRFGDKEKHLVSHMSPSSGKQNRIHNPFPTVHFYDIFERTENVRQRRGDRSDDGDLREGTYNSGIILGSRPRKESRVLVPR